MINEAMVKVLKDARAMIARARGMNNERVPRDITMDCNFAAIEILITTQVAILEGTIHF